MGNNKERRAGRPSTNSEKSVSRVMMGCLEFLEALVRSPLPGTLAQISRAMDAPQTRTHRYLKTLTAADYLRFDEPRGLYGIGPALSRMMASIKEQAVPVTRIFAAMRVLTNETGLTSVLCGLTPKGPVVLKCEQGDLESAVSLREGTILPIYSSAAGRIFLGFAEWSRVRNAIEREIKDWNGASDRSPLLDLEAVQRLRNEIAAAGITSVRALRNPSLTGLAAPIIAPHGGVVFSLALIGFVGSFDDSHQGLIGRKLKSTAAELSGVGMRITSTS